MPEYIKTIPDHKNWRDNAGTSLQLHPFYADRKGWILLFRECIPPPFIKDDCAVPREDLLIRG